ncbi:hypothetical protein MTF68_05335 [Pseudoalteromonas sp. 2CM37A]|uniref:hypothetical protein n=1 Tax=Pseudoalteromonas sp. 2CM37A TaxID=2929853 RepID=UPI0020C06368|nr:hypothetical protein [Pseudoalteromonas sp. 2CM37A]MCK8116975.1 hypothetical protein [Pseudoalteromonas sp. 2CM37A]
MIKKLLGNLIFWYVIAVSAIFGFVGLFFFKRFGFNLNAPIKNWVDTASYFNGVLTPPLLAITSILIFLTWHTSKKELKTNQYMLSEQLKNQKEKESFALFIDQIEKLNDTFIRKNRVIDIFKLGLIFEINNEYKQARKEQPDDLYDYISNLQVSFLELLKNGRNFSVNKKIHKDTKSYTKDKFNRNINNYKKIILNALSIYYIDNYKKRTEVINFYSLLMQLSNQKREHRDTLLEFKLGFNNDIAKILILKNDKLNNDLLD